MLTSLMADRRRGRTGSDSTVHSVDENTVRYRRETNVLKRVSPGSDVNDWPCFMLVDATVYNRDGGMANLLNVDTEGPFTIRGRLDIESDQDDYSELSALSMMATRIDNSYTVQKSSARSRYAPIEIRNNTSFSIGLKADDIPVVWASGETGWFELEASEKYTPIATSMFQAIQLHYKINDQYEEELARLKKQNKKKRYSIADVTLPFEEVFLKYAVEVGDGATYEEVKQRCRDHAAFLISQNPEDSEFHRWLKTEAREVAEQLEAKRALAATGKEPEPATTVPERRPKSASVKKTEVKGKGKGVQRTSVQRSSRGTQNPESSNAEVTSDDQRGSRTRSTRSKRQSPTGGPQETDSADVEMCDLTTEVPLRPRSTVPATPTGALASASASALASAPAPVATATGLQCLLEVLNLERAKTLDELAQGRATKHPDAITHTAWQSRVYYDCSIKYASKAEVVDYFAKDLVTSLGPEWHGSALYKWAKTTKHTPKFETITEEEILSLSRRHSKGQDRSKRPKGSEVAATPNRSGKTPVRNGRPTPKAAGLRPFLSGKKRTRKLDSDNEEMADDEDLPRKRTTKTSAFFSDEEIKEQVDDTTSEDGETDNESDNLEPLTRLAIRAEKMPTTYPVGPNNTWTCAEAGCEYVVRAADEEEGQEFIRKHFEAHEQAADDEAKERQLSQINLAMQEGARGHMPIEYALFPPFLILVHYSPPS